MIRTSIQNVVLPAVIGVLLATTFAPAAEPAESKNPLRLARGWSWSLDNRAADRPADAFVRYELRREGQRWDCRYVFGHRSEKRLAFNRTRVTLSAKGDVNGIEGWYRLSEDVIRTVQANPAGPTGMSVRIKTGKETRTVKLEARTQTIHSALALFLISPSTTPDVRETRDVIEPATVAPGRATFVLRESPIPEKEKAPEEQRRYTVEVSVKFDRGYRMRETYHFVVTGDKPAVLASYKSETSPTPYVPNRPAAVQASLDKLRVAAAKLREPTEAEKEIAKLLEKYLAAESNAKQLDVEKALLAHEDRTAAVALAWKGVTRTKAEDLKGRMLLAALLCRLGTEQGAVHFSNAMRTVTPGARIMILGNFRTRVTPGVVDPIARLGILGTTTDKIHCTGILEMCFRRSPKLPWEKTFQYILGGKRFQDLYRDPKANYEVLVTLAVYFNLTSVEPEIIARIRWAGMRERMAIAWTLGRWGTRKGRDALLKMLDQNRRVPLVLEKVAQALATLKEERAIPKLIRALRISNERARHAVHLALQKITNQTLPAVPSQWEIWLAGSEQRDSVIAELLPKLGEAQSEAEMTALLIKLTNNARAGSSGESRQAVLDVAEDFLSHDSPALRLQAVQAILKLGSVANAELLADLTVDPDETVKNRVQRGLLAMTRKKLPRDKKLWPADPEQWRTFLKAKYGGKKRR